MGTFDNLTFTILDGENSSPEYCSLEISPHINGLPLSDIVLGVVLSGQDSFCREFRPKPEGCLPYVDVADYMKRSRSFRKRLFFCDNYECGCVCDFSASIRTKGSDVILDQFAHHCHNYDTGQSFDNALDIRSYVFEEKAFMAELERVCDALVTRGKTSSLALPTALMRVFLNDKETSFFVHGSRKNTWINPGSKNDREFEAFADGCLDVLIPLSDKVPGDKVLVCFDNITWEYETSDEQVIFYSGLSDGFHYGICVPDDDPSENGSGPASSFVVETMLLEEFPDRYLFNDIQFEVIKCKERNKSDFIVFTLAWCSAEKEHAADIVVSVIW